MTEKGNSHGNLWFTSQKGYVTIRRASSTRAKLLNPYKIHLFLNNINAAPPTDVGFFIHLLARNDTVETTNVIRDKLPPRHPHFQKELTTQWIRSDPSTCTGVGVLKIFLAPHDVNVLTKLFQQTFHKSQHISFVSSEFLNSLDQDAKNKYIQSQVDYKNKYRLILVKGIKNYHVHTTMLKHNKPLTIKEWLLTIPDYQGKLLFHSATTTHRDSVELQLSSPNLPLALKWANPAHSHIARVCHKSELHNIFSHGPFSHLPDSDPWDPPPPSSLPSASSSTSTWTGQIPRSISQPPKTHGSKQHTRKNSQIKDSDDTTVATVATSTSYSQNEISTLQSESRQMSQQVESISHRMSTIKETVRLNLQNISTQTRNIEHN
jgi:hypothetical protein